MFQDTPIYNRLIAERGDIPAQVRGEAQRLGQELERVMRPRHRPGSAWPGQDNAGLRPRT
ncbi:hypothetical protein [Streptomyces sp. NBC_01643]|uniref:hypothetical protein n=1 Tax=Streptomyces sp. NBC_01643 TaxID=2975906 RepID=UPI002F916C14|nr:hypothetical protein OHB03_46950 [Streptomyces sp. NBC_01643]